MKDLYHDRYEVLHIGDRAYIKKSGVGFVDYETIDTLLDGLHKVAVGMDSGRRSQGDILRRQAYLMVLELGNNAKWVTVEERKDVYESGPCVYFATIGGPKYFIKIGRTVNLARRTKSLQYDFGLPVKVLTYAQTDQHELFESAIHTHMDKHRMGSKEIFETEPVLELLDEFVDVGEGWYGND